jgi:hypothetical protein
MVLFCTAQNAAPEVYFDVYQKDENSDTSGAQK